MHVSLVCDSMRYDEKHACTLKIPRCHMNATSLNTSTNAQKMVLPRLVIIMRMKVKVPRAT